MGSDSLGGAVKPINLKCFRIQIGLSEWILIIWDLSEWVLIIWGLSEWVLIIWELPEWFW